MRPEIERAIQLIRKNDPTSTAEALDLLQNTVFSFSMKVCGQRQDAEDTMQEVLVQALRKLSKFDSAKALVVWLYKVAKTRCLMSRRTSKFAPKEALDLDKLMPDRTELALLSKQTPETPETGLLRRESAQRLRDAIQKLPPEYRLVLVLRDMEELSDLDVAEIMGLKAGTVRVRLHRARLFVRRELARQAKPPAAAKAAKLAVAPPAKARGQHCAEMFARLSDYLDEELDKSMCLELEKHIESCEPCQAFLASLERTIEQCRAVAGGLPTPVVAAKLRRALFEQYQNALSSARHSP